MGLFVDDCRPFGDGVFFGVDVGFSFDLNGFLCHASGLWLGFYYRRCMALMLPAPQMFFGLFVYVMGVCELVWWRGVRFGGFAFFW